MEETMFDAGRRPFGRLFYWLVMAMMISGPGLRANGAAPVPQSGPATTTISDTVFLADGSKAQGNLIITWPAFLTASSTAVAGGMTTVTLGANGALSVALVPNAGASPAGVYYTVVYQLGPGEVRTEYWVVPTTSPANLAAVRTTPGSGTAGQPVSMQYVNSGLATKADDSAVVHLNGAETISGVKTFAAAPTVPAPTSTGQVANKAYVDQSVSNVGAGNYLPTTGGTMTGPITLPSNPASGMQAATKQYVDQGFSAKADLISGFVPANELGSGAAGSTTCLLGNGTWGACGGGGGPAGVASGAALVSNGVGQASIYQTKAVADVRDWGVDCTGATDPTAILNSHTGVQDGIAGQHIIIPAGCILKLTSDQWQIYGNEGWEIEGVGILASKPLIEYCGPAGRDSVLKIERSGGWTIKGVNIQDGGAGCSNTTPNGVVVDNDRSGGYTTTDGLFERVQITPYAAIANWTGVNVAPTSNSNTEDLRFYNSLIGCANSTGAVGVYLGSSFNAKMEDFQHTQIVQCPGGGVYQYNGGMLLRGMDTFGNAGDVVLGPGSDPTLIEEVTSESPQMITTSGAANYPVTITSSHEGWAGGGLSAGLCGVDLTHAFNGQYVFLGDGIDTPPAGAFPLCATTSSNLTMIGTQFGFGNNATSSGNAGFILPNGKNFGATYGFFNGGRMRMGNGANYGTEDIGYGFFTQYGAELPGYGFNAQSLEDAHVPGTLNIGRDVMYIGNENITFKGMWPIPMQSISCSYTGAAGSTQWSVEVFPKDAAGNRGGLISLNGRQCGSGAAMLDASDYLTVAWPRVTSAVSYDVVLVNPSNISQGLLFANIADSGSGAIATATINSGSTGSTFNYAFPNFYDSAITDFYGEALNFHLPLTLKGSTSGSATISVSATGGTLNLGSTNAQVTAGGALTVTSCSGCGSGGSSAWGSITGTLSSQTDLTAALAAKAGLTSGLVPASQLGTGTPSATTCLLGNGTWGACSSAGFPAVGVANSTGSGWGTSYTVGTAAGNLLALDTSANLTLPGNLTINGQFAVAGPWLVSSIPSLSAMVAAAAGHSSLGVSNDGNFYISTNAGTPSQVATTVYADAGVAVEKTRAQAAEALLAPLASPSFTGTPTVPGYVPTSTMVNGHALASNVTVSASDVTTGTLPHAQLPGLVSGDIPANAANTSGTAANLSGTPALPNGTTATTQAATDSSTKLATMAAVHAVVPPDTTKTPWITAIHGGSPAAGTQFSSSANQASVYGVVLPFQKTTSTVSYNVVTADSGSSNYDIGIYSGNPGGPCTLVAHTGPVAATTSMTAGWHVNVAWTGGSVTLQPGRYYLAITSADITSGNQATITSDIGGMMFVGGKGNLNVTAGGTLDASVTCPSDWPTSNTLPALVIN